MNIKMKKNEIYSDITVCKEDLERFLKENNIHISNVNIEQLYEYFLLFQKFMEYMRATSLHNDNKPPYTTTTCRNNNDRIKYMNTNNNISKRNVSELNSTKTTNRECTTSNNNSNSNTYTKVKKPRIISQLKIANNLKKTTILTHTNNNSNNTTTTKQQLLTSLSLSKSPSLSKSIPNKNKKQTASNRNTSSSNITKVNNNNNNSFKVHSNNNGDNSNTTYLCRCNNNSYKIKPITFQHKQTKNVTHCHSNNHQYTDELVTCSSCSRMNDLSFTIKERNSSNECLCHHHVNETYVDCNDTIKIIDQHHCWNDKERFKEMFDNEVQLLQKEKEEVTKLKNEYSKLKQQLHKDIEEFNKMKQNEFVKHTKCKGKDKTKMKTSHSSASKQRTLHINTLPQTNKNEININELNTEITNTKEENVAQLKQRLNEANIQIKHLMSKINEHNNTNSNTNSNRYTSNSNPHLPSQYAASSISITDKINYILNRNTQHKPNSPDNNIKRNNFINTTNTNTPPKQSPSHTQSELISNIIYKTNLLKQQQQPSNQQHFHYNTTTSNNTYTVNNDNHINNNNNFTIPSKYILPPNLKVKSFRNENNKTIKIYSNGVKEILYKSGIKKQIFPDNYNIIYYTNNDIKQIFPDKHSVYYSSETKGVQHINTLFTQQDHQLQNDNHTTEEEEMSSNETERTVKQHVFPNVQISCTEIGNGVKEIKYSSGNKVYEFE